MQPNYQDDEELEPEPKPTVITDTETLTALRRVARVRQTLLPRGVLGPDGKPMKDAKGWQIDAPGAHLMPSGEKYLFEKLIQEQGNGTGPGHQAVVVDRKLVEQYLTNQALPKPHSDYRKVTDEEIEAWKAKKAGKTLVTAGASK